MRADRTHGAAACSCPVEEMLLDTNAREAVPTTSGEAVPLKPVGFVLPKENVVLNEAELAGIEALNDILDPMVLTKGEGIAYVTAFQARFKRPHDLARNPLRTMMAAFASSVPRDALTYYVTTMRERGLSHLGRTWRSLLEQEAMMPTARALYEKLDIEDLDIDHFSAVPPQWHLPSEPGHLPSKPEAVSTGLESATRGTRPPHAQAQHSRASGQQPVPAGSRRNLHERTRDRLDAILPWMRRHISCLFPHEG